VKGKIITKLGSIRTCKHQIVFLYAVLFTGFNLGCYFAPPVIPAEITGKYITTHRGYENHFFELGSRLVTMGFGGGVYKYYSVEKIRKEIIENRTLYTILCVNENQEEEFNFAFFVDFSGNVTIHFKNKPKVAWYKQVAYASYNNNLFKNIQH
jgi:hypothetical protein